MNSLHKDGNDADPIKRKFKYEKVNLQNTKMHRKKSRLNKQSMKKSKNLGNDIRDELKTDEKNLSNENINEARFKSGLEMDTGLKFGRDKLTRDRFEETNFSKQLRTDAQYFDEEKRQNKQVVGDRLNAINKEYKYSIKGNVNKHFLKDQNANPAFKSTSDVIDSRKNIYERPQFVDGGRAAPFANIKIPNGISDWDAVKVEDIQNNIPNILHNNEINENPDHRDDNYLGTDDKEGENYDSNHDVIVHGALRKSFNKLENLNRFKNNDALSPTKRKAIEKFYSETNFENPGFIHDNLNNIDVGNSLQDLGMIAEADKEVDLPDSFDRIVAHRAVYTAAGRRQFPRRNVLQMKMKGKQPLEVTTTVDNSVTQVIPLPIFEVVENNNTSLNWTLGSYDEYDYLNNGPGNLTEFSLIFSSATDSISGLNDNMNGSFINDTSFTNNLKKRPPNAPYKSPVATELHNHNEIDDHSKTTLKNTATRNKSDLLNGIQGKAKQMLDEKQLQINKSNQNNPENATKPSDALGSRESEKLTAAPATGQLVPMDKNEWKQKNLTKLALIPYSDRHLVLDSGPASYHSVPIHKNELKQMNSSTNLTRIPNVARNLPEKRRVKSQSAPAVVNVLKRVAHTGGRNTGQISSPNTNL